MHAIISPNPTLAHVSRTNMPVLETIQRVYLCPTGSLPMPAPMSLGLGTQEGPGGPGGAALRRAEFSVETPEQA